MQMMYACDWFNYFDFNSTSAPNTMEMNAISPVAKGQSVYINNIKTFPHAFLSLLKIIDLYRLYHRMKTIFITGKY